jgi:hypothetical protein
MSGLDPLVNLSVTVVALFPCCLLVVADKPLRQHTLLDKKIPCLWLALCLYGKSQQNDFTQSHPQKGDVVSVDQLSTSGWTFVLN